MHTYFCIIPNVLIDQSSVVHIQDTYVSKHSSPIQSEIYKGEPKAILGAL